jgi:thiol-disulfide isomerase/thioredoxin
MPRQLIKAPPLGLLMLVLALVGVFTAPAIGQQPEGLLTLDGQRVAAEALEGDAIVVFFASWSPRCRDVVERATDLEKEWGKRARVFLVAFQESEEDVRAFLAGVEPEVEVLRDVDGSFSKRHGITTLPSLLVLEGGATVFRGRLTTDAQSVLRPIFG